MTPSPVHEAPFDAKETAAALVRLFPALGPDEQRLSLELYRSWPTVRPSRSSGSRNASPAMPTT